MRPPAGLPVKRVRCRVLHEVRLGGRVLRIGELVVLDGKDASRLIGAGHVEPARAAP